MRRVLLSIKPCIPPIPLLSMIILPEKTCPILPARKKVKLTGCIFVGINDVVLLKHALEPYGIHELVIEDILSRKQRPKIEDYGSYVFTAAQVYHYTSTGKLHSDQVYVIIGKDFVLSFQQKPLACSAISAGRCTKIRTIF